jgi:ankyrin repeat protein
MARCYCEVMNHSRKQWLIVGIFILMFPALGQQNPLHISNSADWENYRTVWQSATLDEVQMWLQAGADVNARDDEGRTILMVAARLSENPEVITTLLQL